MTRPRPAVAAAEPARPPGVQPGAGRAQPAPEPEAAREPDAPLPEPVHPGDLLSGAAAEQAIAESAPPPGTPPEPDAPALLVSPLGVGPYPLGLPRQALLKRLGRGASLARARTAPGEPTLEEGYLVQAGVPLVHFVLVGGRVTEITVLARDHRAVTTADVGVGSTFDDALLAHGEPRRVGRGWVLSALPGVILAPADPGLLAQRVTAPPPSARIGRLIVVGPESD